MTDTATPQTQIGRLWLRSKRGMVAKGTLSRTIESACILAIATLIYLAVAELAVRIAIHAPLLEWRDFRHERAAGTINKAIEYDSLLGWRLKPFLTGDAFNTRDYGFRSNGRPDDKVQTGGVLAVGSSFTAGSGVVDSETWPAHLQQLTGWNVNNAGQGAYQADQIILLGEQLLPLIRPHVLVVDLIPGTIIGTGYASSGWPKPYFTIENGNLIGHNSPAPQSEGRRSSEQAIKRFLGHFAALDKFMATFFANFWFTSDGNSFVTVSTDEVRVTCRLLERLKQKTDAAGARLLLYLQYGGLEVMDGSQVATAGRIYNIKRWIKNQLKPLLLNTPPRAPDWREASTGVGECARAMGIATVDELAALRTVYETNTGGLQTYYQIEPSGAMGHKSSFGNREVAKLVASAIGKLEISAGQKVNK